MKYQLTVEGMMCDNCVAHVQKALSSVRGVLRAEVDLSDKSAVVEVRDRVKADSLKKAVEEAGYSVTEVNQL